MREVILSLGGLGPHVLAVALIAARLLPVAFLCPLFGGLATPSFVKLALTLALSLSVHVAGGVEAPELADGPLLAALVLKELVFGVVIGLLAAIPFDAARMGGRFIDLFRGTSAEAALPGIGSRESASGELLHQLVVALAVSGAGLAWVLGAVFRSFALVPLGAFAAGEPLTLEVVRLVGGALGTALAIGAPVAGLVMAVDCLVGMASRIAPQMGLTEVGTPLKILGGGAVLWLSVGLISDQLLAQLANGTDEWLSLLGGRS